MIKIMLLKIEQMKIEMNILKYSNAKMSRHIKHRQHLKICHILGTVNHQTAVDNLKDFQ